MTEVGVVYRNTKFEVTELLYDDDYRCFGIRRKDEDNGFIWISRPLKVCPTAQADTVKLADKYETMF